MTPFVYQPHRRKAFRVSGSLTWHGTKGFIMGNYGVGSGANDINVITISSAANATDYANLTAGIFAGKAVSSSTRICLCGGVIDGSGGPPSTIDHFLAAATSDATDFGDMNARKYGGSGGGNGTRGLIGAGRYDDSVDYITIDTPGNALDFGDQSESDWYYRAGVSNSLRMVETVSHCCAMAGDTMDYYTIATPGNATELGDLIEVRDNVAGTENGTRGVWSGGRDASETVMNEISYFTVASSANATDAMNLYEARRAPSACTNFTRGVTCGGSDTSTMDYYTIASLSGTATDFGDLINDAGGLYGEASQGHLV